MGQRWIALAAFLLAPACGIDGNGSFEESENALVAPRGPSATRLPSSASLGAIAADSDDACGLAGGVCLPAAEPGEVTCPEGLEAHGASCGRASVCCVYVGLPETAAVSDCPRNPAVEYLGESPEVCDAIEYLCPKGAAYSSPCGCGCLGT